MTTNTNKPDQAAAAPRAPRSRTWWVLVPLAVFAAVLIMFAIALRSSDPSRLPSALLGARVPEVAFAPLEGLNEAGTPVPGFSNSDLTNGQVLVVNFWASWCGPCVAEHPLLGLLKERTGVAVYGVNYKDDTSAARRFLGRYGNPFTAVGVDANGRGAIEWGVYGMPETFVVNGRGEIVHKHIGPLSAESLAAKVIPAIEAARRLP